MRCAHCRGPFTPLRDPLTGRPNGYFYCPVCDTSPDTTGADRRHGPPNGEK